MLLCATIAGYLLWGQAIPAPSYRLTTLQGQHMDSSALKNKVVLVNFWASSCPACMAEMPGLRQLYQDYAARGFQVVAIAMAHDQLPTIRTVVQDNKLPFIVSHDQQGDLAQRFGDVQLTPTSILIDRQGNIVQRTVGPLDLPVLQARIRQLTEGKSSDHRNNNPALSIR